MNFLNKKYTSNHQISSYNNNNSYSSNSQSHIKTFLPSSSTVRENGPQIGVNNCEVHQNQLIRHMCLECVQMLCAQCIGDHVELHRQANNFPKIQTIKQLKVEMSDKLQSITSFMNHHNTEKMADIENIKSVCVQKIEQMRREMIKVVDEWVGIMRNHLLDTIGFNEINEIKMEMSKLYDEVGLLRNTLHMNTQPSIIKKIFQIDAEKLEEGYRNMYVKYCDLKARSDFQFQINWKDIISNFQNHVSIKGTLQHPSSQQKEILVQEKPLSSDHQPSDQPSEPNYHYEHQSKPKSQRSASLKRQASSKSVSRSESRVQDIKE